MTRRKLFPATLTPSLDDETATLRLHALTEAMRLLAPMVIRLISLLHCLNTSLSFEVTFLEQTPGNLSLQEQRYPLQQ